MSKERENIVWFLCAGQWWKDYTCVFVLKQNFSRIYWVYKVSSEIVPLLSYPNKLLGRFLPFCGVVYINAGELEGKYQPNLGRHIAALKCVFPGFGGQTFQPLLTWTTLPKPQAGREQQKNVMSLRCLTQSCSADPTWETDLCGKCGSKFLISVVLLVWSLILWQTTGWFSASPLALII